MQDNNRNNPQYSNYGGKIPIKNTDLQTEDEIKRGVGEYPRSKHPLDLSDDLNPLVKLAKVLDFNSLPSTLDLLVDASGRIIYASTMRQFSIYNASGSTIYVSTTPNVDSTRFMYNILPNKYFVSQDLIFKELYYFMTTFAAGGHKPILTAYSVSKFDPATTSIT